MKLRIPLISHQMQTSIARRVSGLLGERVASWLVDDHDVSIKGASYPAVVTQVKRETAKAVTLTLELEEGHRLHYRAGQSICLSVQVGPVLFRRHHALSSAPDEHRLTVTVKRIFKGRTSGHLVSRAMRGARVFIEGPEGEFTLPALPDHIRRYVFLAAGSGIAPIRAMLVELLGRLPTADVTLVYACRSSDDVIFRRELEGLAKRHPGFRLVLHFSRRDGYSNDLSRRLAGEQFLGMVGDVSDAIFYVCAPAGLTKSVADALTSVGVPESSVKIQLFTAQTHAAPELKARTVVFEAAGLMASRYSLKQPHVGTLADAAREAGVRIEQGCSTGNCNACRVKVVHGTVIMDEPNSLSTEDARQGHVLACLAYPCENVVVRLPRS